MSIPKKALFVFCFLFSSFLHAQNIGIGTNKPDSSAILELQSNSKGLLPPRMSSTERDEILKPATGLLVYDTDLNALFLFNGTRWVSIDQTNQVNNYSRINPSYHFTPPQFLETYGNPSFLGLMRQSVSISENLIVSNRGIGLSNQIPFQISWGINKNGNTALLTHTINHAPQSTVNNAVYGFDIDTLEQNIYAVINNALFKLNINNPLDTVKIADNLGNVAQVKVLANNDVIITTDLNNGSLIRVLGNGTKQIIASNLRFPNYFDVYNNNFYVTGLNALTGTVKKITPAGLTTNLVTDIIAPKSIVFDKNGNFVLQTNLTIGVYIYIKYDMFNSLGEYLGPVNDASDNPILTYQTLNAPMYRRQF